MRQGPGRSGRKITGLRCWVGREVVVIANRILSSNSPSDLVHVRFNRSEQRSLLRLYLRGDLRSRRLCVDYLRAGLGVRGNRQFILGMCDRMIPDRSTYVRWQALLMLGQHAERHPDEIWPSVLKWGTVKNRDIRQGVACCVLEHVLEHHFDPYFDRALSHIAGGHRRFAYTLAYCWRLGQAGSPVNAQRFDAFKRAVFPRGQASWRGQTRQPRLPGVLK